MKLIKRDILLFDLKSQPQFLLKASEVDTQKQQDLGVYFDKMVLFFNAQIQILIYINYVTW